MSFLKCSSLIHIYLLNKKNFFSNLHFDQVDNTFTCFRERGEFYDPSGQLMRVQRLRIRSLNIRWYCYRHQYELGAYGYGKNHIKLLHVRREDAYRHDIREYEVDTHLRLGTQKDYFEGNNRDIIATDSQKNTVYLLAKKYGVKSPEEFGILLCAHFLYTYGHVEEVHVNVIEYPWERHQVDGVPHNHAFVFTPTALRHCQVGQLRNGNYHDPPFFLYHDLTY